MAEKRTPLICQFGCRLISHRLNAIRNCDFVLQMDRGGLSVVEPETVLYGRNGDV